MVEACTKGTSGSENYTAEKDVNFLISNFCLVLYVVCIHLGNSSASEFYMLTFLNTQSVSSS
jgi:hypothetical protein